MQITPTKSTRLGEYEKALAPLRSRFDSPPLTSLCELFPGKSFWQIKNAYYGRTLEPLMLEVLPALADAEDSKKKVHQRLMRARIAALRPATEAAA